MIQAMQVRYIKSLDMEAYYFAQLHRSFPMHFHAKMVLGVLLSGSRRFYWPNGSQTIGTDDLVYVPAFCPHGCEGTPDMAGEWLSFHYWDNLEWPSVPQIGHWPGIGAMLKAQVWQRELRQSSGKLVQQMRAWLQSAERAIWPAEGKGSARYGESPTPLPSRCSLNKYQWLRKFRKATGITPRRYEESKRVLDAMASIKAGVPLGQAAAEFYDQSHLTRVFKKNLGVTPGQWQRAHSGGGPNG